MVNLADLQPLLPVSIVIVGALSFSSYLAYRLGKHALFLWISVGWLCNLIYLIVEVAVTTHGKEARAYLTFACSLPTTYCFAWAIRKAKSQPSRTFDSIIVSSVILNLLGFAAWHTFPDWDYVPRFLTLTTAGILLTVWILLTIGVALKRMNPLDAIALVRGPNVDRQSSLSEIYQKLGRDTASSRVDEWDETFRRRARKSQATIAVGILTYGALQFFYPPFQVIDSFEEYRAIPFYIALASKLVILIGIWVLMFASMSYADIQLQKATALSELAALTASIEHDVRTPLTTLQLMAPDLEDQPKVKVAYLKDLLDRIESAIDIVPLFRETSQFYLQRGKRCNLVDMTRTAIKRVKERFADHPTRFVFESEYSSLLVQGIRKRITQALVNLLTNAHEATPPGGIVNIKCVESDNSAVLSICNPGHIDMHLLPRISAPFVSTKDGRANRGLGLYIAKRIIEAHGGTTVVSNENSTSVRVQVELPCVASQRAKAT